MAHRQSALEGLVDMFLNYYAGKCVLLTGHTGFKGAWLSLWLRQLGARVVGYSLPAPTSPSLHETLRPGTFAREFIADIRNLNALRSAIQDAKPDFIFHLAAQPLVRLSYATPLDTLETNVMGTAYLLDAVRQLELGCPVLVVTSDKCYENQGWEFGYRENDAMGGHDIYSASKGAAELVVQSWRRAFFAPDPRLGAVATARAGNVIGGGDYAQDRIIPDCIRSLIAGQAIPIRNPQATRPWQHVLDCLSGYLWLGARLAMAPKDSPITSSFNFGPGPQANLPVKALVEELLLHWPGQWRHTGDVNAPAEAHRLNLCIDKAAHMLQWHPTWDYAAAVRETVQWYHHRHVRTGQDMDDYSSHQITRFALAAQQKGLAWATPSPA